MPHRWADGKQTRGNYCQKPVILHNLASTVWESDNVSHKWGIYTQINVLSLSLWKSCLFTLLTLSMSKYLFCKEYSYPRITFNAIYPVPCPNSHIHQLIHWVRLSPFVNYRRSSSHLLSWKAVYVETHKRALNLLQPLSTSLRAHLVGAILGLERVCEKSMTSLVLLQPLWTSLRCPSDVMYWTQRQTVYRLHLGPTFGALTKC